MSYIPSKINNSKNDFFTADLTIENEKAIIKYESGSFSKEYTLTELFSFLDNNELSILRLGITNQYRISRRLIVVDNDGILEFCSKVSSLFKASKTYKESDLKPFDKVILGNRYGEGEFLFIGTRYTYYLNNSNELEIYYKYYIFCNVSGTGGLFHVRNPLILNISDVPRVEVDINLGSYKVDITETEDIKIKEQIEEILKERRVFDSFRKFPKNYMKGE